MKSFCFKTLLEKILEINHGITTDCPMLSGTRSRWLRSSFRTERFFRQPTASTTTVKS